MSDQSFAKSRDLKSTTNSNYFNLKHNSALKKDTETGLEINKKYFVSSLPLCHQHHSVFSLPSSLLYFTEQGEGWPRNVASLTLLSGRHWMCKAPLCPTLLLGVSQPPSLLTVIPHLPFPPKKKSQSQIIHLMLMLA